MKIEEKAFFFDCLGERMLGVMSLPADPLDIGVVVVVGGPQYRAGSHRQFVSLARRLAGDGIAVLRFDYRGMGDSEGALRSFEAIDADIGAAINALRRLVPNVHRIALWGLCDGASAALMYVDRRDDARVTGLVLVNPWVRSQNSLARTHLKHYYLQRLGQRGFWTKVLRGGFTRSAAAGLLQDVRAASQREAASTQEGVSPFQARMANGWSAFKGSILLLLSDDDFTAREFTELTSSDPVWQRATNSRPSRRVAIPGDHTCSTSTSRQAAENETLAWVHALKDQKAC